MNAGFLEPPSAPIVGYIWTMPTTTASAKRPPMWRTPTAPFRLTSGERCIEGVVVKISRYFYSPTTDGGAGAWFKVPGADLTAITDKYGRYETQKMPTKIALLYEDAGGGALGNLLGMADTSAGSEDLPAGVVSEERLAGYQVRIESLPEGATLTLPHQHCHRRWLRCNQEHLYC